MRKGDTGAAVTALQRQLAARGYAVEIDGWYGDATEAAVLDFQLAAGLVADGIAGQKTQAALVMGQRSPLMLGQANIDGAAARLGVERAVILAVNEVESAGSGFDELGHPKVLFERHVMYRRLHVAGLDADDMERRYPDLVNRKRGGYRGGAREWYRLDLARQIADVPAIESASWGLFQVMGYHWELLEYASALDFVAAMSESEGAQLDAFVRFILADPALHKALKARKWPEFAKLYNGPDYKANLYDVKLPRAYEKHAGRAVA